METFWQMGLWTYEHFVSMDILARGLFRSGIFWHMDFSARGHFSTGTCIHRDFSSRDITAWVRYNTRIFQHYAQHKDILTLYRNVPMLKCPSAVIFQCQNVFGDIMFICRNVCRAAKYPCQKNPWWNVRVEMSLVKMSNAEKSPIL